MEGNFVESGELIIRSFLPEYFLKDFDLELIDIDTFLEYLAKARYMQKVWKNIVQVGVWEEKDP